MASLAQGITLVQTEDPKLAELAFTAGLLHDIGKLVFARNVPQMYATARKYQQQKRASEAEAELVIMGTTHAEFGACLLATWGLPLALVEAVGSHDRPSASHDSEFSVLTAVHTAKVLAHEMESGDETGGLPAMFDTVYLIRLGLTSQRNVWREACGLPIRNDEATLEENIRRRSEARYN